MRSPVITLREHGTAQIAETWSSVAKCVTRRFANGLDRLQARTRTDICTVSHRFIKAHQHVGSICVEGHTLDIVPKVDCVIQTARQNLIQMLVGAGMVPSIEAGIAGLDVSTFSLLDIFMLVYLRQLSQEWRRGRILSYRKLDQNRVFLRGKLLFQDQVAHNLLHPERFFTRADEFLVDIPICRLLKAAVSVCRVAGGSELVCRQALELLPEFDGVDDVSFPSTQLMAVSTDRRTERFAPAVALAKLILSSRVPDQPGEGLTFSLLFDMNVVFERLIGRLICGVARENACLGIQQDRRHSLLVKDGKSHFGLRPDTVIYTRDHIPLCIVDTKWKQLNLDQSNSGVNQGDIYQAYAYGKEFGCKRVIILYPRTGNLVPRVAVYRHRPGSEMCPSVEIWTIDVCGEKQNRLCPQLRVAIDRMIFHSVTNAVSEDCILTTSR